MPSFGVGTLLWQAPNKGGNDFQGEAEVTRCREQSWRWRGTTHQGRWGLIRTISLSELVLGVARH